MADVPFPQVLIINLDHRTDRWACIEQLCRDCDLSPVRIPAVCASPGWVGCGHSHLSAVKFAEENHLPWVLVLEDDASFDKASISRFRSILPYLWAHRDKWERFSGGPTFPFDPEVHPLDIHHHQLMYIKGYSTHFDLIQRSAYASILTWTPEGGRPIDVFYNDLAADPNATFRSICTYPHIATQSTSTSDVLGGDTKIDQTRFFSYSTYKLRECLSNSASVTNEMLEVEAIHPHWRGALLISKNGNLLKHQGTESIGVYTANDERLIAEWYDFPKDVFFKVSGCFVHADIVSKSPALSDINVVRMGDVPIIVDNVEVRLPDTNHAAQLRLWTSDASVFRQIFIDREYENINLPDYAKNIIDLGANIGLSTVFFALRYPEATILAVEPEPGNYCQLLSNVALFINRVESLRAAAWSRDGTINLVTEDAEGRPLASWGVQVADGVGVGSKNVPCLSMTTLLGRAGMEMVDILKIDIEGAEREVFEIGASEWLARIGMIIIETHDRFRPGSEEAVRNAVEPTFDELPSSGENLVFRRKCIEQ